MPQNSSHNFALLTWTVRRTNRLNSAWNTFAKNTNSSEPLRCLSAVSTQSILTGLISFELISLRRERSSSEMNSIFTSNSLHGHYNAARELASSESDSHRFMKTSFRMEQSVSSSSVWLLFQVTYITYVFSVSFLIPHSSHAHFYKQPTNMCSASSVRCV